MSADADLVANEGTFKIVCGAVCGVDEIVNVPKVSALALSIEHENGGRGNAQERKSAEQPPSFSSLALFRCFL